MLQACIDQPAEWKQRYGFPEDVQQVAAPIPEALGQEASSGQAAGPSGLPGNQPPSWQRVILDRPERLLAVLILVAPEGGGDRLHGYGVRQDGWVLQSEPAFTLAAGWQEPFPELLEEPSPDLWRQAWRGWCQPRGLTTAETDTCPLQRIGHRLRVELSSRFMDRLRSSRSDALKGEAWLLAGEGRVRTAALLEVVEVRQGAAPTQA